MRRRKIFGQTLADLSVIAEGVEGGRRNGVYRVRSDQFFDVQHIAISRVLGAGAGPQHALSLCSFGSQSLPAGRAEDLLILLVGLLAVRDRYFSLDTLQLFLLPRIFGSFELSVDDGIHH